MDFLTRGCPARSGTIAARSGTLGGGARGAFGLTGSFVPAGAFVLVGALLLAGCDALFGPGNGPPPEMTELPRALSPVEEQVVQRSQDFAFDLLGEVAREEGELNVFLSPLSASMALAMTANGARGETYDEMADVLGFGDVSLEELNEAHRDLTELLLELDPQVDVGLANSLWLREGFQPEDGFVDRIREHFRARVEVVDFTRPSTPEAINRWAGEETAGILDGVVEHPMDPDLLLYLVNAVYFRASWREAFDRADTGREPFLRADGEEVLVDMMNRQGTVRWGWEEGFRVVELPYASGAYVMTILLPDCNRSLAEVVGEMDGPRWAAVTADLREEREARVALPRIELEYGRSLVEALRGLGMERPFSDTRADFTGIHPDARRHGIHISEAEQDTYLRVDEEGTEAAAVTRVGVGPVSAPPEFRMDRPFLLTIRERLSGTVLFVGLIHDPSI